MRKIVLALAGMCMLPVHAEIVTFEFTGLINTIREVNNETGTSRVVASTALTPSAIAIGATFSGLFNIDTDGPVNHYYLDSATYLSGPLTGFYPPAVTFDSGWGIAGTHRTPTIVVVNGSGGAGDSLSMYVDMDPQSPATLRFEFQDRTGTAFASKGLPRFMNIDSFSDTRVGVSWNSGNGETAWIDGSLTSLTRVTSVPEPSSYVMLLAGAAVIGGAVRRRKLAMSRDRDSRAPAPEPGSRKSPSPSSCA